MRGARSLRGVLVGTLLTFLLASVAWGSNLTQVRVGAHGAYTRVVLQLDGAAPYELTRLRPRDGGEKMLFVEIDAAQAGVDSVPAANSPHVSAVRIDSVEEGKTRLRVRLAGDMELKELVLRGPDRIVLDFYPPGSGAAPLLSTLTPPEIGGVASNPTTSEPRPSIEAAHASEFDQALRDSQAADAPSTQPQRVAPPVEEVVEAAAPEEELASDLAAAEEAIEAEVVAGADTADEALDEFSDEAVEDAFEGVEIAEVVPEPPAASGDASSPPAYADAPEEESSSGLLGNPIVLAALAGIAIIGLVFALGRRRGGDQEEDASLSPLDAGGAADDVFGAGVSAQDATTDDGAEALLQAEALDDVDDDAPAPMGEVVEEADATTEGAQEVGLFDSPETGVTPATETDAVDEGFDYPAISPPGGSESAVPISSALSSPSDMATGEVGKMVEEFDRRIAHLENRLEEVVDAKERLERQVAAQTEELRVQRAAIARTQRVLRTIARPEDEDSSPGV